jgi:hypothetical protein
MYNKKQYHVFQSWREHFIFLRCEFSPQAAILEPAQPGPEVPRVWAMRRAEWPPRF